MIVYQTHEGIYVGSITLNDTDKCPITGDYIVPGGCCTDAPPDVAGINKYKRENGQWVEIITGARTTLEAKEAKISQLKIDRLSAEMASPFVFSGCAFDYDVISRTRIDCAIDAAMAAALAGGVSESDIWTLADNSKHEMTAADWLAFRQAEFARIAECNSKYNSLKMQVESLVDEVAAGTKTETEAITAINAVTWS